MKRTMFAIALAVLVVSSVGAAESTPALESELQLGAGAVNSATRPADTIDLGTCELDSMDEWVLVDGEWEKRGGSCGGNTCGLFQYCCNPSCGTCVFYGMSCTQQSCN